MENAKIEKLHTLRVLKTLMVMSGLLRTVSTAAVIPAFNSSTVLNCWCESSSEKYLFKQDKVKSTLFENHKKVSINITSKMRYVYILRRQMLARF